MSSWALTRSNLRARRKRSSSESGLSPKRSCTSLARSSPSAALSFISVRRSFSDDARLSSVSFSSSFAWWKKKEKWHVWDKHQAEVRVRTTHLCTQVYSFFIFEPSARCGRVVCGTAQTPARDPSLSNAPAWTSWPAPPPTPCGRIQSAMSRISPHADYIITFTAEHYQTSVLPPRMISKPQWRLIATTSSQEFTTQLTAHDSTGEQPFNLLHMITARTSKASFLKTA